MQTCPGFFLKSLLEYPGNLLEICSVKSVDTLIKPSPGDVYELVVMRWWCTCWLLILLQLVDRHQLSSLEARTVEDLNLKGNPLCNDYKDMQIYIRYCAVLLLIYITHYTNVHQVLYGALASHSGNHGICSDFVTCRIVMAEWRLKLDLYIAELCIFIFDMIVWHCVELQGAC